MVVLRGKRKRNYVEASDNSDSDSDNRVDEDANDDAYEHVDNDDESHSDDDDYELNSDDFVVLDDEDDEPIKKEEVIVRPKRKVKRAAEAPDAPKVTPMTTSSQPQRKSAAKAKATSTDTKKMKQTTLFSMGTVSSKKKDEKKTNKTKKKKVVDDDYEDEYEESDSDNDGNAVESKNKKPRSSTSSAPQSKGNSMMKKEAGGAAVKSDQSEYSSNSKYAWLYNTCDAYGVPHSHPDSDPTTVTIPESAYRNMKDFEKQYWQIKKKYFDVVLLTKSGTFYELYQTDALIGAQLLDCVVKEFAGMLRAGFYETAFLDKASILLQHGYKVGRVEQTERKKAGSNTGLVNRELVQILTDATLMDEEMIGGYSSKILLTIKEDESKEHVGVAFSDASTATIYVSLIRIEELEALLYQVAPISILCEHNGISKELANLLNVKAGRKIIYRRSHCNLSPIDVREKLEQLFSDSIPEVLTPYMENDTSMGALGILLGYLKYLLVDETILSSRHIIPFENTTLLTRAKRMVIDGQSLSNLEVLRNIQNNQRGTLVEYMNRAVTSQGKRLFERWLCSPLVKVADIESRLECIEDLHRSSEVDTLRSLLSKVPDVERMLSKVHYEATFNKDAMMYDPKIELKKVQMLLKTLGAFKKLKCVSDKLEEMASHFQSQKMIELSSELKHNCELIATFETLFDYEKAVSEGKIYPNRGANPDYDALTDRIDALTLEFTEELEQLRKKVKSAKHVDSRKDLYLIEVPKNTKVPKDFTFVSETKQVSRYYSPLVKSKLDKLKVLMSEKTEKLKEQTKLMVKRFDSDHQTWRKIVDIGAELDCLISLCSISFTSHLPMTRPVFVENASRPIFDLKQMTHPCIRSDQPVPNSTSLGMHGKPSTIIVTGPNSGGKSSLLRQNCVAIIMAQIGCYVPAQSFTLTPVDRIFTRIGANDRIMAGESTFMVEMNETASILRHATDRSFVILDEMGRGTCTFDGLSIAFSVVKYLAERIQCRTLFSTHYSDLAEELKNHPFIDTYQMSFVEDPNATRDEHRIIFTYHFIPGVCSKSYGMNVARCAGIQPHIVQRAEYWANQYQEQLVEYQESRHSKDPSLSTLAYTSLFDKLLELVTSPEVTLQDRSQLKALQSSILEHSSSYSNTTKVGQIGAGSFSSSWTHESKIKSNSTRMKSNSNTSNDDATTNNGPSQVTQTGLLFDLTDEMIQVIQQAQAILAEQQQKSSNNKKAPKNDSQPQQAYPELSQFEIPPSQPSSTTSATTTTTTSDENNPNDNDNTHPTASNNKKSPLVPLKVLKQAVELVNNNNNNHATTKTQKLYVHKLIKTSKPSFPEPPPPPPKDPKYLRRLAMLQKAYDDSIYAQMVANVNFRQVREQERDPFSTYKGQLGVGLDLVVTVFTFFVIGYYITSTVFGFHSHNERLIGGLIGAVLGLFVDGILVIIRGGRADELQKKKLSKRSAATAAHVGKSPSVKTRASTAVPAAQAASKNKGKKVVATK